MDKIILNLIKLQNQIRILHWQTRKYSEHEAFGKAYAELDVLLDQLVEVHQGKHGQFSFEEEAIVELVNYNEISIMDVLSEVTSYLSEHFSQLHNSTTDTDCLNIRDEILSVLNKLKYLLTLS
jgi:vesicle coat complex subunit